MITDQDAEDAVEFLENNAIEAAQARADCLYCDSSRYRQGAADDDIR